MRLRLRLFDILRASKISHVESRDTFDCKILFVFYTCGRIEKYGGSELGWCQLKPFLRSVNRKTEKKLEMLHKNCYGSGHFILDHSYYNNPMRKPDKIDPEWTKNTIIQIIEN